MIVILIRISPPWSSVTTTATIQVASNLYRARNKLPKEKEKEARPFFHSTLLSAFPYYLILCTATFYRLTLIIRLFLRFWRLVVVALHSLCAPRQSNLFLLHDLRITEHFVCGAFDSLIGFWFGFLRSRGLLSIYPLKRRGKLSAWIIPDVVHHPTTLWCYFYAASLYICRWVYNSPEWCIESEPKDLGGSLKTPWGRAILRERNRPRFTRGGIA